MWYITAIGEFTTFFQPPGYCTHVEYRHTHGQNTHIYKVKKLSESLLERTSEPLSHSRARVEATEYVISFTAQLSAELQLMKGGLQAPVWGFLES